MKGLISLYGLIDLLNPKFSSTVNSAGERLWIVLFGAFVWTRR